MTKPWPSGTFAAAWILVPCVACRGGDGPASLPTASPSIVEPLRTPAPTESRRRAEAGAVTPKGLRGVGAGFPVPGPWVSFYGTAAQMGDLALVARTFRIINVDADPAADGTGNFTDAQLRILRNGGKNRVLSYLNLGSCERFRAYWSHGPQGVVPCAGNRAAWLGTYEGYADETWMDLGNAAYQALLVDYVAARLASRGVDGFYLDNLEIVEHPECSSQCRQGALDVVRRLRDKFPDRLLVMQNATSDVTRLGTTGGVSFPTLLDGIAHEEVYSPAFDGAAEEQLLAWQALGLRTREDHPLFIGVEDYVGSCKNTAGAEAAYAKSRARGFSPYASDESASQKVVCYWPF